LSALLAWPALVQSSACVRSAGCNADNCARAVTGTVKGSATQSLHRGDCSSFLQCTAYPATITVTATATNYPTTATVTVYPVTELDVVTQTTVVVNAPTITQVSSVIQTVINQFTVTEPVSIATITVAAGKRDVQFVPRNATALVTTKPSAISTVVCPTAVPTYASACSGTARFSSACSCFGVTKTTMTMTTPTTTVTATVFGKTTVTKSATSIVTELVSATLSVPTTIVVSEIFTDVVSDAVTFQPVSTAIVSPPASSGNAYCENGAAVNGLSAPCTAAGCSTTNLRIEGPSGTIYEGIILSGPRYITTPSGGTHLCDGTNNGANPVPFNNGISTIDAASRLCGFAYDGTYSNQFDDFFIESIGDGSQTANEYWGILNNYAFTPAGGCETEVVPSDELLWAYNAFNVNYFLRVQTDQMPVVLAAGQTRTFMVQGADGNGDAFVPIAGATFAGQTSDANGNVLYTAPTTPGTYRYKAIRSDSIRSNAVTIIVQ